VIGVREPQAGAVLIVDASTIERQTARKMLAPLGYRIVGVDSESAALRAVARERFAVIVMDARRPSLDGYAAAKLIRRQTGSELTPIIFLAAFGSDELETATAYASGGVDFVFTPILAGVLRAKVSTFVKLVGRTQELEESVVRAQAVLDNVVEGIVTATEAGVIESLNRSALHLLGYCEEELIGQPLDLVIAPSRTDETTARRKDGSSVAIEVGMSRMQLGERTFTISSIRDISGRKQRVERDRVAFEEAPFGSVMTSRDGRIERVNHAICTMTGYRADELIGTAFSELAHPDDRRAGAAAVDALVAGGRDPSRFESRFLRRGGEVIEATVGVSAIRNDGQEIDQLFTQIEDVTDARRTSRELEQAQFEMLARLAAAAEFHDDDTGQHTHRVGELSVRIAARLGLPAKEVELLRLAAALHDVGKIAIPDGVLSKRSKLSAHEYELMKTHTTVGAAMLADSAFQLIRMAEEIALTHHEHWDGSGYPLGLAGEAIPTAGRIVAVADVFDALTHVRPYKPAWSTADAIAEMQRQSGRRFDPQVLDAFLTAPRVSSSALARV
jgi:putative two-component system response regulator